VGSVRTEVEWYLKTVGAVESEMEEPPRSRVPVHDAVALAKMVFDDDDS
jgi:hypothetical protein